MFGRPGGLQYAKILLCRQHRHRPLLIAGGDDDLGEDAGHLVCHLHGHFPIGGDHPAVGGNWVAGVGRLMRGRNGLFGNRNTARVGVFNNSDAGAIVIPGSPPGGIGVSVVVVAHFLAVQLCGLGQPGAGCRLSHVEGGGLVGVFPITQFMRQFICVAPPLWEAGRLVVESLCDLLLPQPGCNGHIVGGGVLEGRDR